MQTLSSFVQKVKQDYPNRLITVVDGYEFNQHDQITEIELYTNSRFVNGNKDDANKLKPFYNITTRLLINQQSAEDIDTKDMVIETDYKDFYVQSFLLTKQNQKWMKESNFALTLNQMTEARGKYGGVLVKKVEDGDKLSIEVVDLVSAITDPVDILGGVKVLEHHFTPAQLKLKEKEGWKDVDAAIQYHSESNQSDVAEGENRDTFGDYIKVYEVHGVLPKSFVDENADEYEYSQQVHIICGLEWGGEDADKSVPLFSEETDEQLFKYLPYRKVARRSLGWGVIEEARESQIWTNDAVYREKLAMEFAGTPILQSPVGNKMAGKNIRNTVPGTVLKHTDGKPYTSVNFTPGGLQYFTTLKQSWDQQVSRATSTTDVNTGAGLPSGTAYRLGALLNEEANKPFEKRREEMGIFLNEVYQDWVLPFLIRQLQQGGQMAAELSFEEMRVVDEDMARHTARNRIFADYFAGKYNGLSVSERWMRMADDEVRYQNEQRLALSRTKNKRYFDYPADYFDGATYKLTVNITNEQKVKAVYLETISNILNTVATNPNILKDPVLNQLFNQIMESAGYSPVELDTVRADVAAMEMSQNPAQPQAMDVGSFTPEPAAQ